MIALAVAKAHLRVDHDADDADITRLCEAALEEFEHFTERTLVTTLPDPVGDAVLLNEHITQGALLLVGSWYSNREHILATAGVAEWPRATTDLWWRYRRVGI
jgi:hypothetical protein